jgi:4'-phosphopantetheinyl transferase
MNGAPKIIFDWPAIPPLPPLGQPTLIRVVVATFRPAARQKLRMVLRQVLAAWSGILPGQLPLQETARGPIWAGTLNGHSVDISLSYANGEGWIAFLRGGWIGVDAMPIQPVPEAEDVARHYLGRNALTFIQQSSDPALAFAQAWTEREARLKCLKLELFEWSEAQSRDLAACTVQHRVFANRLVVTVACRFNSLSTTPFSNTPVRRG